MSQGLHVAHPHSPHQHVPSRLCSILSAAYRFYSCCCYTKISDSAGGPDHLSFFASSDQLSYLNNCFDLLSFSSPRWTRYDLVAFSPLSYRPVSAIPKSVYFRPSLCHCLIDRVYASVSISLYLIPSARFPSCRPFCSSLPSSRSMNRCAPLLMPLCM